MSSPSDTPEIRPALTPEQWKRAKQLHSTHHLTMGDIEYVIDGSARDDIEVGPLTGHDVAALCLYGVLRHEHLEALDDIFSVAASTLGDGEYVVSERSDAYRELREIVASLLPPKEE